MGNFQIYCYSLIPQVKLSYNEIKSNFRCLLVAAPYHNLTGEVATKPVQILAHMHSKDTVTVSDLFLGLENNEMKYAPQTC